MATVNAFTVKSSVVTFLTVVGPFDFFPCHVEIYSHHFPLQKTCKHGAQMFTFSLVLSVSSPESFFLATGLP